MAKVNKLSFVLGMPNTYVQYDFNKKHSLKILGDLNDYSATISNPFFVNETKTLKATTAVSTKISIGIEYDYWFYKDWGIMFRGLYSIYDNYELRNNDNHSIYNFNSSTKPYVTIGIKYRLKKD